MHRRIPVLALLAAFAVSACSPDDVAGPPKVPTAPKFAISTSNLAGSYIVLMKANAIAQGFADQVTKLGGTVTYSHAGAGFATVSGLTASGASQLGAMSGVAEVDADAQAGIDGPFAQSLESTVLPDVTGVPGTGDPTAAILGSWQWNMRAIGADKAWAAGKLGSSVVTVAILDTGLDYDDFDLNGLVDLSRSASFANTWVGDTTPTLLHPDTLTISDDEITATLYPLRHPVSDYNGHGTNVAAQVSSQAFAFAGVTSKTTLIGVKVLGRNGKGNFGQILSGVLFAADQNADVANMSLGGSFSRAGNGRLIRVIDRVFDYAKRQKMLIVVSAGNDAQDLAHNGKTFASFCDAPHVVCVSAVGPVAWGANPDERAFYTNFGKGSVDLAAPGGNGIPTADGKSLIPTPGWPWAPPPNRLDVASWVWGFCPKTALVIIGKVSGVGVLHDTVCRDGFRLNGYIGTSQAAPHVTGLAALLAAENGQGHPHEIKQVMRQTAVTVDRKLGRGRISVSNALGL